MADPVPRHAITSEWSQKIESACVATVRAATWRQNAVSSPAILYMLGIIRSRPCDAVNVVASAPACSAPCAAPAAPASDCSSAISGTAFQRLTFPRLAHSSQSSAIGLLGVMGYMAIVSLARYATDAAASLPSTVIRRLLATPDPSAFVDASTEICSAVRVTAQLLPRRVCSRVRKLRARSASLNCQAERQFSR